MKNVTYEGRYIDADAFVLQKREMFCDNCEHRKNSKGKFVYEIGGTPCRACDIGDMIDAVDDFPAADVVPVIRCKNCQNFNNKSCATGYGTCLILGRMMKNDEYCCYGKERDNEVDHTDRP